MPADQTVPDGLLDELITPEAVEAFEDAETLARVRHGSAGLRGWDLRLAEVKDALAAVAGRFYAAGVAAGRAQAAADLAAIFEKRAEDERRQPENWALANDWDVAAQVCEDYPEGRPS
jgi:hypothetical protein